VAVQRSSLTAYIAPFIASIFAGILFFGCASGAWPVKEGEAQRTAGTKPQARGKSSTIKSDPWPEVLLKAYLDDRTRERAQHDAKGVAVALATGWSVAASDDLSSYVTSMPYSCMAYENQVRLHYGSVLMFDLNRNRDSSIGQLAQNWTDSLAGESLALSSDGSIAAIGAPNAPAGKGGVYLYEKPESGWATDKDQNIDTTFGLFGRGQGREWGQSVALSGDGSTFAWGAPDESGHGMVYYAIRPYGGWGSVHVEKITESIFSLGAPSSEAQPGSEFGRSIAISRDDSSIVVGAPGRGAAYYFRKPKAGWPQVRGLQIMPVPEGIQGADRFGSRVALSSDGKIVAVSAPKAFDGIGAIFVFVAKEGDGNSFVFTATKIPIRPGEMGVGISLALSTDGRTLAFGCLSMVNEGTVEIFATSKGDWSDPKSVQYWKLSQPKPNDFFGYSIALSGDGSAILMGAPGFADGQGKVLREPIAR